MVSVRVSLVEMSLHMRLEIAVDAWNAFVEHLLTDRTNELIMCLLHMVTVWSQISNCADHLFRTASAGQNHNLRVNTSSTRIM